MKRSLWKPIEELFLRTNYSEGVRYCANKLNRSYTSVESKVKRMGLKNGKNSFKSQETYDKELAALGSNIIIVDEYRGAKTPVWHEHTICGHTWLVTPTNILSGKACPACQKGGFNYTKPAYLYLISFIYKGFKYYKLGITNRSVYERWKPDWDKLALNLEWQVYFKSGNQAASLEKELLDKYKFELVNTGILSSGNTETVKSYIPKPQENLT